MKRRGITVIEVGIVLATIAILWVIVAPVLQRPRSWSQTPMPALRFQKAPLWSVFARLHQELLRERRMGFIKNVRFETSSLQKRTVTLQTSSGQTLGQVIKLVEKQAGVAVQTGGSCGTCGLPMGRMRVVEAKSPKFCARH